MDIQPGKNVTVTVTRAVTRPAAQKTLARIFLKDDKIFKARNHDPKVVMKSIRAGRIWNHRNRGSVAVCPSKGDSATVQATVDVIRDIHSVASFVDVK